MEEDDDIQKPELHGEESGRPRRASPWVELPWWLQHVSLGVAVAAVVLAALAMNQANLATHKGAEQQNVNLGQQHHAQTMRRVDQLINSDPLCTASTDARRRCLELVESVERMSSANASDGSATRDELIKQIESGALAVGDTHMLAVVGESGGVIGDGEVLDQEYVLSLAAPAFDPELCTYIWDETFCLAHYHHNSTGAEGISMIILDSAMAKLDPNNTSTRRGRRFNYDGTVKGLEGAARRGAIWGGVKGGVKGAFVGAKTGGFGSIGGAAHRGAEWGAVKGGFRGAVHYVRRHFHRGSAGHH
jgi:hypothetical protein